MKSEGCRNYETNGLVIIILKKKKKHIPSKCFNTHQNHYKHNAVVTIPMSLVALMQTPRL